VLVLITCVLGANRATFDEVLDQYVDKHRHEVIAEVLSFLIVDSIIWTHFIIVGSGCV